MKKTFSRINDNIEYLFGKKMKKTSNRINPYNHQTSLRMDHDDDEKINRAEPRFNRGSQN